MQQQNIEFLKQFRQEDIALPSEQRPHRNLCFRHYGIGRKERHWLERFLEKKITQTVLIGGLVSKMEREDRRIDDLLRKMQKSFTPYGCRGACPAGFIARLSAAIDHFRDMEALYRGKMQLPLLNTLRSIGVDNKRKRSNQPGSREIRYILNAVRQYLDDIHHYHDIFSGLLEEEYGRTGACTVSSPAEEALIKLATLIKSQLFATEATLNYLTQWRKRTREVEVQGIYN